MPDKKPHYPSEWFHAIFGQKHRYITADGTVWNAGTYTRTTNRAEFKTILAVGVGIALLRSVFNDAGGLAEAGFGIVAGYTMARRVAGKDDPLRAELRFKRLAIVDTQPDEGQMNSPEDLAAVIKARKNLLSRNSLLFQGVFLGLAVFETQNIVRAHYSDFNAPDFFGAGIWVGSFGERAINMLADFDRCNRIISGKYVMMKEPPEKQALKSYDHLKIRAPEPLPNPAGS